MVEIVPSSSRLALARAGDALRAGEVVVIPTDTVYGVAVDPFAPGATERLFAAKRRPRDVTLPVLVASPDDAEQVAVVTPLARDLAARHWPGGLTIVLDRVPGLDLDLGTNEATVGVRCPDHDLARELCAEIGPLAVTSANLHGEPTPATAPEVAAALGEAVAFVIDGGACAGVPSTVVDCTGVSPVVLRAGAITLPG